MHRMTICVASMAVLLISCGGSITSSGDSLPEQIAADFPEKGIVHWSSFLYWDDSKIEQASRAKLMILPIQYCLSPASEEFMGKLKSLNSGIKIIGYQGLLAVSELYRDTTYVRQTSPYELDYYYLVRERWAWTTTGDTLQIWPGWMFLNPIAGGEPDSDLITGLVDLLENYIKRDGSTLDGIMHDYFMYRPYVNTYLLGNVEGDIDLDGNGILIGDDAHEREIFLKWQIDFAWEIRSRFGPDFIQIGNGRVPQENAELAGIINGVFYELFPNMCWGVTDRDGFQKLLDNQRDGYLAEAYGRTWSIVTNDAIEYNNWFCLISSLLAGCLYTEIHGSPVFSGWSIDLEAGRPLSDLAVEGRADSMLTYRRAYSSGEARISFASYGGRKETLFIENDD